MFGIGNIKSTVLKTLTGSHTVSGLGVVANLGAPGDVYLVTDTRKNPRKELDQMRSLQRYNIEPYTPETAFASESGTVLFPVKELNFDRKNFQNRETDFSDESVLKIIKAVKDGKFNWSIFDAITIWQNPADGKFYVLSGHSRSEAFKRLAEMGESADGKNFTKIPAKIFKGTFDDARELALNSNTLSTKETNFERANYYRALYNSEIAKGRSKAEATNIIMPILKEREGKNANSIFYISFLNPNGIFYDALRQLQNAPTQDRERLKVVGEWVGRLRKDRSKLTDFHERELFDYLITQGNYNKTVTNYADLLKRIDTALLKMVDEKGNFQPERSLNLKKNIVAEGNEKAFLQELDRLKRVAADDENLYNQKLAEFRNRQKIDSTITDEQILKAVEPYRQRAVLSKADYNAFRQKRAQYIDADRRQTSLFGLGKPTVKFEFETNEALADFLKDNQQKASQFSAEAAANPGFESTSTGKKTPKLEFEDNEELFNSFNSIDGLTVNDKPAAVFNCPEAFLQCKGFTPTYTRLEDYSFLIEPATGEKRLVGYGFEGATLEQLKNACKNYQQVAKLAAHLKGDTELQSAFNVWHWLHTNIYYNYDTPGEEEIRTPARTWADRESGVDCDCLAVFTACLLGAMGYKPRFEIVAFGNSPKFSHIYVNLNGAAVDRVLPVFLARPSGITKTKIMEIPVFELSGGGAMEAAATLNGIYESALAKVQAHEATAEDSADLRKSQILMTLQNSDPQAYRLAAILMPYVVAIDDDGAWYFADAKVAEIADKADKKLYELKISEVNENIFNDFFNELLNDFRNISVKVERGSGTTVLTISFNNPADDAVTITGDFVKKDFIALNPNFLTMRESLKNLLAVNYLGLASKYAVGLMTEQEAVAAGYSVETWKKAVKAFETLTRFWVLIGGKAENIADIILNGSAKEPLTDKNINYEANIVATSDTDAILNGCKKRGLSGLNGLGETPTVASDIENLGEEGLEKILDWCSDIETEEEKAAENSDEDPVNVLAQNATPAAAAFCAPAATGEKNKSLLWWLLGGAALGGGIAAATGRKKNKRMK